MTAAVKETGAESATQASDLPRALGRYMLLRRIARGGMGEVFLASTTGIEGAERPVVVKIIRREHAKDPSFIARFLDEARVQAQLQHSGVAQVLEAAVDTKSGEPYAVVEHVEGRSLGDVRARAVQLGVKLAWEDAVAIAAMIAEALAHVHERQDASGKALSIVHRDLSPQNVMLSYSGEIKIIDFGTARGQNRRCHTVAGVVFAKPGYVAPEVANGDSGDARVDLYALGVMLWELCKNQRFLQGDANVHLAMVARDAMKLPAVAEQIGAPKELDAIIAKLTAFDRDARYLAGRSAARDLAKLLVSAAPLTSGERGTRARAASLMTTLFPGEPGRSRRDFAKLVEAARAAKIDAPEEPAAPPKDDALPTEGADGEKNLLPGTRYRLRREIGRGASGAVFEAEHVDLGRRVAVKILGAEQSSNEEFAGRFRREARALSHLSHEGLVEILDFGVAKDGRLFSVMELLEGETLEARLGRDRATDWREAFGLATKVLRALEVAHEAGLVHRDIKPANLFSTKDGAVKLLDFGLVRSATDHANGEEATEPGGSIFGTPEYMAPEQAQPGAIDARADVYALGCVLYEAIAGVLPFPESSAPAIVAAKLRGSPEAMRARAPKRRIPRFVDELVLRAMARHPSVRFQTAAEMRRAIEEALLVPAKQRAFRKKLGVAFAALAMSAGALVFAAKSPRAQALIPHWRWRVAPAQMAEASPATPPQANMESGSSDAPAVVADASSAAPSAAPVIEPAPLASANVASDGPAAAAPSSTPSSASVASDVTPSHARKRATDRTKHSSSAASARATNDSSATNAKQADDGLDAKPEATKAGDEKTAKRRDKKHKKKSRLAKAP